MNPRHIFASACVAWLALAGSAQAQQHDPATPLAVAAKIDLRGEARSIAVREMRIVRKNDVLVVQGDLANQGRSDRTVFYRFKWLDQDGFTVWDEEPWKPMIVYGSQKQTISVVAPTFKATDFRLILQSPDNSGQPSATPDNMGTSH